MISKSLSTLIKCTFLLLFLVVSFSPQSYATLGKPSKRRTSATERKSSRHPGDGCLKRLVNNKDEEEIIKLTSNLNLSESQEDSSWSEESSFSRSFNDYFFNKRVLSILIILSLMVIVESKPQEPIDLLINKYITLINEWIDLAAASVLSDSAYRKACLIALEAKETFELIKANYPEYLVTDELKNVFKEAYQEVSWHVKLCLDMKQRDIL